MATGDAVARAIRRWQEKGLVGPELAATLLAESTEAEGRRGARWTQYALATTAAVVLVIAAVTFLGWAWPRLGVGSRCGVLAVVAVGIHALGLGMEDRRRWVPVSYLLQTAALGILLVAFAYSAEAWPAASPGGIVVGMLALATPALTLPASLRRNDFMPAVQVAAGYAFLALFLNRSVGLEGDVLVWILDGVLLLSVALLAVRLGRAPADEDPGWLLNAFAASAYAGLVLVLLTATGPLGLGEEAVYALDLWLGVTVAVTLWGIHRAPPGLRRGWYTRQLALCVLLGIAFGFWTTLGALDTGAVGAALVVGGWGAACLLYGAHTGARDVTAASCLALLSAAWYLGVAEAGALGAVLALAASAALLFWLAGRLGGRRDPDE